MKIEIMITIENQKFFVDPEVYNLWEEYEAQYHPDEGAWAARLKSSLPKELFNEFISLLLAKAEEENRRRTTTRYIVRRSYRR
jgi:transketolase